SSVCRADESGSHELCKRFRPPAFCVGSERAGNRRLLFNGSGIWFWPVVGYPVYRSAHGTSVLQTLRVTWIQSMSRGTFSLCQGNRERAAIKYSFLTADSLLLLID